MTRSPRFAMSRRSRGRNSAIGPKVPPRVPNGVFGTDTGSSCNATHSHPTRRKRQNKEALIAKIHVITV